MRILFLFLLILNLLFAAWQYYTPEKKDVQIRPLSSHLEKLVLLKEAAPVIEEEPDVVKQIDDEQSEKATPVKVCYTLGPYTDKEVVTQIEGQIARDVIDFVVREREEQELHRYWVYLSGNKNRAAAREVSKALAKKNVKDYYIIQKGDKKNSISLGHFKDKAYADARVKKVSHLGFNPQIEVIYRTYQLYWLDYSLEDENSGMEEKIQEYLADGVTLLDRDCPSE